MVVAKVKNPTLMKDISPYHKVRERAVAILDVLYVQPDQAVRDRSGNATSKMFKLLPVNVITSHNGRLMNQGSLNQLFRDMEDAGWVMRKVNGKRVYEYRFVKGPKDWRPPVQAAQMTLTAPTDNGVTPSQEAALQGISDETELLEEEARSGGIRPGRLAARLEKLEERFDSGLDRTIPAIEEAVVAGLRGWFSQIALGLGFTSTDTTNKDQIDELVVRLSEASSREQQLQDELRAERVSNIAAREELNQTLRKQYATRDTTDVRPSEVPEAWRSLATHAINNGWTLHRTGGGHIMWKSPGGFRYFSSSTSSDFRSVRNARADMEKQGLPKE